MARIKSFLILFPVLMILAGTIFFFWPFAQTFFQVHFFEIETALPKMAKLTEKEIFTPPPFRGPEKAADPQVILSQQEITKWTNIQREKYGLEPLQENFKLKATAQTKIEDMLENQYFAHQSPLGEGVGDLAEIFTYEFLNIGENLAMGNFESEEKLVQAWMESPGHRENILHPTYQEIGVAVQKGQFEGKSVWLAVQHFGLPLAACPQPKESDKLKIQEKQKELKEIEESLSELKKELQKIRPRWSSDYQQKLEEYNKLVEEYNKLVEESKALVNQYNAQVLEFNQCLAKLR